MRRGRIVSTVVLLFGGGIVGVAIADDAPPSPAPAPSTAPPKMELPRQEVDLGKGVSFELVRIPAGEFDMGVPAAEQRRYEDASQHRVRISRPYWLATTEVTQAVWGAVMGSAPSPRERRGTLPVTDVAWDDCQGFVKRLNEAVPGAGFRLPTEAEWEYACRATSKTRYCYGDDEDSLVEYAWHEANSGMAVHPVGLLKPNAWGLYDMHGNVHEWCQDVYGPYEFIVSGVLPDPVGPPGSGNRVTRGGGFGSLARHVRSAFRGSLPQRIGNEIVGLRLARTVTAGAPPPHLPGESSPDALPAPAPPGDSPPSAPRSPPAPEPPAEPAKPGGSPAEKGEVPSWAKVAPEQIEAAKEAGVPVAFENSIGMRFVLVPAGTFTMGSPEGEKGRSADEVRHPVILTRPFYVSIHETTNGQYRRFKRDHDSGKLEESLNGDTQPVVRVSHTDATEFARWLSGRESGRAYRLPTESEWEYAARAKTTTSRYWGDEEGGFVRHANIADAKAKAKFDFFSWAGSWDDGFVVTAPVGTYLPNGWGLDDMLGNAWEWCADWKGDYPTGSVTDPTGPSFGTGRVLRGGSWRSNPGFARAAFRPGGDPDGLPGDGGFRLVLPARATR